MANKDITTAQLINVSGNRYRVTRSEISKDRSLVAFQTVKDDISKLENAVTNKADVLTPTSTKLLFKFLLAVAYLVVELAIRVNRLERDAR